MTLLFLLIGCDFTPTPSSPVLSEEGARVKEALEQGPTVSPGAETAESCCCWYTDPSGAGLHRFSSDPTDWPVPEPDWPHGCGGGPYYLKGCVETGVCDVADQPPRPPASMGRVGLRLNSGARASVTGSADLLFSHGEDPVQVLYYPLPAQRVIATWTDDLAKQGFTAMEGDYPSESHGTVQGFEKGDDGIIADFEEGCQGSSGTCVWMISGALTELKGGRERTKHEGRKGRR